MAVTKLPDSEKGPRFRIQLDTTEGTLKRINELRELEGLSMSELFNRSFRVYEKLLLAQRAGGRILIDSPGQEPRIQEIVFL